MFFSKKTILGLFYKVFGPQSAIKHQRNSFFDIKPTDTEMQHRYAIQICNEYMQHRYAIKICNTDMQYSYAMQKL